MSDGAVISLLSGERVLVDVEDFPALATHTWLAHRSHGRVYAVRKEWIDEERRNTIFMHRELLGFPGGKVRHLNDDTLDNRRVNLGARARRFSESAFAISRSPMTNHKGCSAEAAIIAVLYAHGFTALRPFDGHAPYDLVVADRQHNLRRAQVKYRAALKGWIKVELYTVKASRGKNVVTPVNLDFVDAYAIFCPTSRRAYFIRRDEIPDGASSFRIAIDEPRQDPRILFDGHAQVAAKAADSV